MAWARVQSAAVAAVTPAATLTKTFASNVTSGNRVFVYVLSSSAGTSTAPATPTDSQSNTYTQLATVQTGTNNPLISIYTAVMSATGSLTVTVGPGTLATTGSPGSTSQLGFTTQEFSGLSTASGTGCLDQSATGSGTSTSVSLGTTAATTASNQLALGFAGDWGASATFTTSSTGWTKDAGSSSDAASWGSQFVATKTSASGTAETISVASGVTGDSVVGGLVVIKLATTYLGSTPRRPMPQAVRRAAFF